MRYFSPLLSFGTQDFGTPTKISSTSFQARNNDPSVSCHFVECCFVIEALIVGRCSPCSHLKGSMFSSYIGWISQLFTFIHFMFAPILFIHHFIQSRVGRSRAMSCQFRSTMHAASSHGTHKLKRLVRRKAKFVACSGTWLVTHQDLDLARPNIASIA